MIFLKDKLKQESEIAYWKRCIVKLINFVCVITLSLYNDIIIFRRDFCFLFYVHDYVKIKVIVFEQIDILLRCFILVYTC